MDIVAYLRILRRHWKIIAATTMLGALIGVASTLFGGSTASPATRTYYTATHSLFLDTSDVGTQFRPVYTNLDQIAALVTAGDVPKLVAAKLGGDANDWASQVSTVTNSTTSTLDIVCAERTAEEAVTCADTFADQLVTNIEDREKTRFDKQVNDTTTRLNALQDTITQLDAQLAARPPNSELIQAQRDSQVNQYRLAYERFRTLADQGGPPSVLSTFETGEATPISQAEYATRIAQGRLGQNHTRADATQPGSVATSSSSSSSNRFSGPVSRGILGALLGMIVGAAIALAADRADRRLRTREEVEAAFGMVVLAEVPALPSSQQRAHAIVSATAPLSRTAESYRAVRSSLMFQRATDSRGAQPGDALVVMVGSAGPKEGKTTTSANLATLFAETGARVLTINCDFRRPTLHEYFDLPNEPRRVFDTTIPGLWVITDVTEKASGANPALVVEEQRRLIESARQRFDVIILDTAPLLTTNDATELMTSADLVVITCRAGVTTIDGAKQTRELLSRIAAPVSGVVLLGSTASPNEYYYYYSRGRAQELASEVPSTEDGVDDGDVGAGLFGSDPAAATAEPGPTGPEPRPAP